MSVFERTDRRQSAEVSTEEWEVPTDDRVVAGDDRDVSVEDGEGAPSPDGHAPRFSVSLLGYNRRAVDEWVEDVGRLIDQLERSPAPQPSDEAVKRALEEVGEETSAILQRAHEAEETITARAEARAEERLRSADEETRAMRADAEAKVRELDEDTDVLWRERHRLLEDMERLFNQIGRVMAAANRRYPPPAKGDPGRTAAVDDGTAFDGGPHDPDGAAIAALDARTVFEDPDHGEALDEPPAPEAVEEPDAAHTDSPDVVVADPPGAEPEGDELEAEEPPSVAGLGEPFLLEDPSEYRPPTQVQ